MSKVLQHEHMDIYIRLYINIAFKVLKHIKYDIQNFIILHKLLIIKGIFHGEFFAPI